MFWDIHYYKTPGGQEVVKDFIASLQTDTQAKLGRKLDLLEEYGARLGMPHAKTMGNGLIELRVRGRQEVRIFYVSTLGKRMYLLHGFVKKTRATSQKELAVAIRRQKEVHSTEYKRRTS